jgi:LmbE family N-acetylglucosaminyl deacetylase
VIVVLADTEVERALVVVAHPDDVDFWAGGTVAGWTGTGIAVTYCVRAPAFSRNVRFIRR